MSEIKNCSVDGCQLFSKPDGDYCFYHSKIFGSRISNDNILLKKPKDKKQTNLRSKNETSRKKK
jgi:hypothetical protein